MFLGTSHLRTTASFFLFSTPPTLPSSPTVVLLTSLPHPLTQPLPAAAALTRPAYAPAGCHHLLQPGAPQARSWVWDRLFALLSHPEHLGAAGGAALCCGFAITVAAVLKSAQIHHTGKAQSRKDKGSLSMTASSVFCCSLYSLPHLQIA